MNLRYRIDAAKIEQGEVGLVWLGQAGFIVKDSVGHVIVIDPYLTDYCERVVGFKRIMPKLLSADEVAADVLISTHDHPDHFDADAVPFLLSGDTKLIGAESSVERSREMGLDEKKLIEVKDGDVVDLKWCKVTAVYADHGDLAPDAVGIVIDIEGVKIYFAGDTAYRPEKMGEVIRMKPDIIVPPINGEYGNLDSVEAVQLAKDVGAKLAVPCHYWMFAEHKGEPQVFMEQAGKHLSGVCEYRVMMQGEMLKYCK